MFPENLKYTVEHEWVAVNGDTCTVGITAFAAEQLGDITYVELPETGLAGSQGDDAATVESVKAASDVYLPIGGTVFEINEALEEKPELVNESPFDDGWFFKLENVTSSDLDSLMDADAYAAFVKEQDH